MIKPQAAFFELLGPDGMVVLADLSREAMALGLMVVMDAKRGDIGSTSTAYARAWLGPEAGFASDALTINPFLGIDTLEPFITTAAERGAGLFILTRTSNPGSADIQGITAEDGRPVFHHLANRLNPLMEAHLGSHGFSDLGVVAGATWPEEAALLRRLMPSALFLVPGFGAQGAARLKPLPDSWMARKAVKAGLSIHPGGSVFPEEAADAGSDADWRQAIDTALERSNAALRG